MTYKAVTGTLKGYDQLMNLVLDNVRETLHGIILTSISIPQYKCWRALTQDDLQMRTQTQPSHGL